MSVAQFYQSVIQAHLDERQEEAARRSARAPRLHLALDKPVLVDVVKDVAPMMVGGFIYPVLGVRHAEGRARASALGYQADPDRRDQGSARR